MTTEAERDALLRLRFQLELSPRDAFWFGYVVGEVAPRRRLRQAAREDAERLGIAMRVHAPTPDATPDLARDLIDAEAGLHWVVLDEQSQDPAVFEHSAGQLLLRMNERREAYVKRTKAGVILEGPEQLKVLLRNLAPDLFSIRQCSLEPGAPPPRPMRSRDLVQIVPARSSDAPLLNARSALAQADRLSRVDGWGALRSRLAAKARAVESLLAYGWVSEARPTATMLRTEAYQAAALHSEDRWLLDLVAKSEELVGSVLTGQGAPAEALIAWRSACWIRTLLLDGVTGAERQVRRRDLARCRARLGETLIDLGELDEAERWLGEALEIRRALAEDATDPELAAELALTHSALGDLYLERDDLERARGAFEEALELRARLAAEHGAVRYRRHLSVGWGRISQVAERQGDPDVALQARERSLQLALQVAKADPDNQAWQLEASVAWSRFGDLLLGNDDADAAEAAYGNALLIRESVARQDPDNPRWQRLLGVVLSRLAEVALARDDRELARAYAERALAIAQSLNDRDPANLSWRRSLQAAQRVMGEVER